MPVRVKRVPYTFFVKRDSDNFFFLVKRDLGFLFIRDCPYQDHFYVRVKAVFELSVAR